MSRAHEKHKLLTEDQACLSIDGICRDFKTDAPAKIFEAVSYDTVLHRTLYRDYYSMLMSEPPRPSSAEALSDFVNDFIFAFKTGEFNFTVASRPQQIVRSKGWTNILGWDRASNDIVNPMTRVFRVAAAQSFIAQQFFNSAMDRPAYRSPYQNIVMAYAAFSQNKAIPVYTPIVVAQAQICEISIRARDKFERMTGRDMTAADWDMLSPQIANMLTRLGASARFDMFDEVAMVACADDPFYMNITPDGQIKLKPTHVSEATVNTYMQDTQSETFFARYNGHDTTGCPVMASTTAPGEQSYFTRVTAQLLKAVREDFWPDVEAQPAVSSHRAGCPFHQAQPGG